MHHAKSSISSHKQDNITTTKNISKPDLNSHQSIILSQKHKKKVTIQPRVGSKRKKNKRGKPANVLEIRIFRSYIKLRREDVTDGTLISNPWSQNRDVVYAYAISVRNVRT